MKRVLFFLVAALPVALSAQVNEMFYVPKKSVKQESVQKILSASQESEWGVADNGNNRDVDEYNRRGAYSSVENGVHASDVESILSASQTYEEEYDNYVEDDYNYSRRIVRFHNPTTVVVSSPLYWDIYGPAYYSPCYDSYWDWGWSFHWGSGWGFHSSYHWPHWNLCHPHYSWAPHHSSYHHHYEPVYSRSVGRRVPVADRRNGTVAGRRPAIGTAVQGGDRHPSVSHQGGNNGKRPVAQVGNKTEKNNRKNVGSASKPRSSGKSNATRRSSSSTYNRPSSTSSTSVRSSSSSGNRSSSVSRGGTSRSSSRGGTPRGSSRGR